MSCKTKISPVWIGKSTSKCFYTLHKLNPTWSTDINHRGYTLLMQTQCVHVCTIPKQLSSQLTLSLYTTMHFIINQNPPFEELYVTYEIAKWNFILEGFMKFKPKILPFDYYIKATQKTELCRYHNGIWTFYESTQNTAVINASYFIHWLLLTLLRRKLHQKLLFNRKIIKIDYRKTPQSKFCFCQELGHTNRARCGTKCEDPLFQFSNPHSIRMNK